MEVFERIEPWLQKLYIRRTLPCYTFDLKTLLTSIPLADLGLRKEEDNSKKFGIQRDESWRGDYHFLFTDSFKDEEARVGFGVYYPLKNLRTGEGRPGDISICPSETCALDLIDFNSTNKAVNKPTNLAQICV